MKKILTIFKRDWQGKKGVIPEYIDGFNTEILNNAKATEKLDGTNVRITVRNHTLVRLEKRCNPSKLQKHKGIEEPWYIDAEQNDPQDKYIWEAAKNTDLSIIPDGEWSGEALGPKIQGGSLDIEKHKICLFSFGQAPVFENVPVDFNGLKNWLPKQKSKFGSGGIEGIVWHCPDGQMYKIKTKDFK